MSRRSPTPQAVRFVIVAGLLGLIVVAVSYRSSDTLISYAQGEEQISHQASADGKTESWRIRAPNVRQHVTPYPQIRFQPGDRITMEAGGCVQTGGFGRTWKQYVNPQGPNADRMYHGLIWIPSVIGGPAATGVPPDPKRIIAYLGPNRSVTVPSGIDTKQLFLRLGYEDDDYSDNGYNSHDDGTQDQCKGVGNAFVSITIVHGPAGPPNISYAPFDLVWDSEGEDDNGIPLNAKWGWQITHPGSFPDPRQCADGPFKSPCTNWADVITQDTAEICNLESIEPGKSNEPPLFGVAGHVNWAAGTYVGRITWEAHSTPSFGNPLNIDDDYNLDLFPAGNAGLVSVRNNIEVEFDSDETIDHFNTPWWNLLHTTVDRGNDAAVNSSLFTEPNGTVGRYAIVSGLIGLEMCHHGSNELHPAWAMAIRVKDDDPRDEVWAMFVRRWGNEGFCSGNQHYLEDLPGDTYTFRLPWRPGASSVNATSNTTFLQTGNGASGPGYKVAVNQGLLVQFSNITAPQSGRGNIIYGELHLDWPGGQGPAPIPGPPTVARRLLPGSAGRIPTSGPLPAGGVEEQDEPERRIASALAKLPTIQRSQFLAMLAQPHVSSHPQALPPGTVTQIPSLPKRPARPRRKQYQSVPDPEKRERDQRILDAMRRSFGSRAVR